MKRTLATEVRIGDVIAATQVRGRVRKVQHDYIQSGYVGFDIERPEGGTLTLTGKMTDEVEVLHRPFQGSRAEHRTLLDTTLKLLDDVDDKVLWLRDAEGDAERNEAEVMLRMGIVLFQDHLDELLLGLKLPE